MGSYKAATPRPAMVTLAILVGGGPAPGINAVIEAATKAARARGWRVLGVPEGFKHLLAGATVKARELRAEDVEGIGQRGGSVLFTSRANPAKEPDGVRKVLDSLGKLGVTHLVTIGGDDTATSAAKVAQASGGRLRIAHVPKTIDNDLPLPQGVPTFGFETAHDLAARLLRNLAEDARTTRRVYLVTVMGRSAGHLAAAAGMSAGADLTLLPEEFGPRVRLLELVDRVEAAVVKRLAEGQRHATIVLAEGLLLRMEPSEFAGIEGVERDEHGNPRVSEVSLGSAVKRVLAPRLKARGLEVDFVAKELGYELRCEDPVGFDAGYARALGLGAVEFLATRQEPAAIVVVTRDAVRFEPLEALQDPATGKVRVRAFDTRDAAWRAHRRLEARLWRSDLEGERLGALARAAGMEEKEFLERFRDLAEA